MTLGSHSMTLGSQTFRQKVLESKDRDLPLTFMPLALYTFIAHSTHSTTATITATGACTIDTAAATRTSTTTTAPPAGEINRVISATAAAAEGKTTTSSSSSSTSSRSSSSGRTQ